MGDVPPVGCGTACATPPPWDARGPPRPFCSIFVVVPRLPPWRLARFSFGEEKRRLGHSEAGGEKPRLQGLTNQACLGQGAGRESGSPAPSLALGAVTQSRQHPNPPEPWLDPLGQARLCPTQDLPLQGCSGTRHWAVAGRRRPPKPPEPAFAGSVRAGGAGAISTHLFGQVVFAKMGKKNPGSGCGLEELRYLGAAVCWTPGPGKHPPSSWRGPGTGPRPRRWPRVSLPCRRSELVCFISPLSGSVSVSPPSLALSFSLAFL